jgi:8-oxo-dGTP diphosphatase
VWRPAGDGIEVLLIHRPRYRDWSFPKGKAKEGETGEDCALREVEEETGLRCPLGAELATTSYRDAKGRKKVVRYWAMELPDGAEAAAGDGVDDWRWVTPEQAEEELSWQRDLDVLRSLPLRDLA